MRNKVDKVIKNLEKRSIKAKYFDTTEEAKKAIIKEAESASSIGIGGSMTIKDMGLYETLLEDKKNVNWHWMVEPEKRGDVLKLAATSEIYLSSTNALTENGELLNIDGVGNRVSGMYFGPKKVIIVCGINKICSDLITAMDRIKEKACPPNAKRLGLKTPCAVTGHCTECFGDERMCNVTVIINHKPKTVDLNVYIIGENLGF